MLTELTPEILIALAKGGVTSYQKLKDFMNYKPICKYIKVKFNFAYEIGIPPQNNHPEFKVYQFTIYGHYEFVGTGLEIKLLTNYEPFNGFSFFNSFLPLLSYEACTKEIKTVEAHDSNVGMWTAPEPIFPKGDLHSINNKLISAEITEIITEII